MCFFFLILCRHPASPLFPYTTLFRSQHLHGGRLQRGGAVAAKAERLGDVMQGDRRRGAHYTSSTDRKSTRLNSSHANISYAVFCLKKKKTCPSGLGQTPSLSPQTQPY